MLRLRRELGKLAKKFLLQNKLKKQKKRLKEKFKNP